MTADLVVFAHLGHWYVGGPVYLSPVVAVFLFMKWSDWRHRRDEAREAAEGAPKEPADT
jgi:hypothetical protein